MNEDDRELLREAVDRARRTETRVTKIANHIGVDAGGDKPRFDKVTHTLTIPSRKTSLDEILDAIPPAHRSMVRVCCGGDYMTTISV